VSEVAEDQPREPEPYEPGPPETGPEEEATRGGESPTREQIAERNERFSRPRKPMGPAPEDDRRIGEEEAGPPADVPPTPPPEPVEEEPA
jgi:hypothetical protein